MLKLSKLLILCLTIVLSTIVCVSAADLKNVSPKEKKGKLVGRFAEKGNIPLANGRAFIYDKAMGQPSSDRYVRVPDYLADLDKAGKFSVELPPGTYYIIARKAADVAKFGPPAEGQLIYFKMNSKKEIQPFVVRDGKTTNSGVISTAVPRKRNVDANDKGVTVIEGTVIDAEETPVAGAVIYAYVTPDVLDKALYVSEKTAADGKFLLRLTEGGNYFLRVRGYYGGGMPQEGDLVNINDPKELVPVTVNNGEKLKGITVKVTRQTRGPLYKGAQ